MATEFYFTPELHLKVGRIIRDLEDAKAFAREQEARSKWLSRARVPQKLKLLPSGWHRSRNHHWTASADVRDGRC
jgi:hypothetical protein